MIKILWLLKRKAGITPEQFRERYERHARLGQELAGHLISRYKRNYKIETKGGGTPTTLATAQDGSAGLAVDDTNVYWANAFGGAGGGCEGMADVWA